MAGRGMIQTQEKFTPIVEPISKFGLDLYHQLRKEDGNLFLSPFSISIAIAMTHVGCRGNTHDEVATATYLKEFPEYHQLMSEMNQLIFAPGSSYTLNIANRLFGHQKYTFLEEFLATCSKHYGSELERMNFDSDTEGCREKINQWVEEQTANKIKELIQPGVLNSMTRLVLVNAIYFKGNWDKKFEKEATQKKDFFIGVDSKIKVDMMNQERDYAYNQDEKIGYKSVEIPYEENHLSMFVVLPDSKDGLEKLESKLDANLLKQILSRKRPIKVNLQLPKFKFEKSLDLKGVLQALGIKDLFNDSTADLSGMDGSRNLFISKALTKAFIDVNEEGSEAAAATAMVAMLRCAPMPRDPIEFIADHPFLFLIRDNRSGAILFMGRIMNPAA